MNVGKLQIYHSDCGGLLGYIEGINSPVKSAKNFHYNDGTQPKTGDNLDIYCPKCAKTITEFKNMTPYMFDEWE